MGILHVVRRDAILQLTTVLQRLHKAGFCTAANLYDLTKAFDMLSNDSVQSNVKNDLTLHNTARTLLLDMQGRLRIRMPVDGGNVLYVKLGAGVLQRWRNRTEIVQTCVRPNP